MSCLSHFIFLKQSLRRNTKSMALQKPILQNLAELCFHGDRRVYPKNSLKPVSSFSHPTHRNSFLLPLILNQNPQNFCQIHYSKMDLTHRKKESLIRHAKRAALDSGLPPMLQKHLQIHH